MELFIIQEIVKGVAIFGCLAIVWAVLNILAGAA
jgi:hypothetical protein